MNNSVECFIGLGSNLPSPAGSSFATLQNALDCLSQLDEISNLVCSSCYISKPIGPQNQDDYHNAVAKFSFSKSASDLLDTLHNIEQQYGRDRQNEMRWGARSLDLDILLFGNEIILGPTLNIPHPEMQNRAFVVFPMLELDPELTLPNHKKLKTLAENCQRDGIIKLPQKLWPNSKC